MVRRVKLHTAIRLGLATGLAAAGIAMSGVAPTSAATDPAFDALPAPQRIADTRPTGDTVDGQAEQIGRRTADSTLQLLVAGRAGVDAAADVAVLNVTAVNAAGKGFLTIHPCDQPRPDASNLNFVADQVIANAVFAKLDGGGRTCIYTSADVHLIVDVTGSMPDGALDALAAPRRIADTRPAGDTYDGQNQRTGPVAGGTSLEVQVSGRAGVGDADSAVLNLTVAAPANIGFLTVYPCDQPVPNSSNLNYRAGQVIANSVLARLDGSGRICVFTSTTTNIIVDVAGTMPLSTYQPLATQRRLVDTRAAGETYDRQVERTGFRRAGTTIQIPVGGRADVPADASAVVLNVTATRAAERGFMTIHPRNTVRPNASNLNFSPDDLIANSVVAPLGGNGMVCIYASADVELIVDVAGYLSGPAPVDTGDDCPREFPPGTHPVGEYQMPAGRYVTSNGVDSFCEVRRWEEETWTPTGQLGAYLLIGGDRVIIDVLASDGYVNFGFSSCNPLVPYAPPDQPATTFGSGMHVVNLDIVPGTYRAQRLPNLSCGVRALGTLDGRRDTDLFTNTYAVETEVTFVVPANARGVWTSGCTDWAKIG